MFKHLFASMNEMLGEVSAQYATAKGSDKKELQEKLQALKAMSDTFIEEWLLFEEKLAAFYQTHHPLFADSVQDPELAGKHSEDFARGQGFYKLLMFDEAIKEFSTLVRHDPEFTLARVYLAMSYLRNGEETESYSHFHFLSQITNNNQMKAISFNAMGCIQAYKHNMDKALEYFNMAFRSDPSSVQPLVESGVCCCSKKGELQFFHSPVRK
ncbi:hypothetical protein [Paenibacillus rigui]|uniref:Uncharacterized protein n=1 Tax=Paenibacillus rigui TaxID=554312 RepID=A0A229UXE7_9BACL|nr:hypothetical protein [Paenibacillus rigui]OXM88033.1 hypothetical protein CF651_02760 [Paenibacillus rigui]